MTYDEIIRNNCMHNSPVEWWPKYAFHYTDVSNAVSILKEGWLYSRQDVTKKNLMLNDNASRQVIDMTSSKVTSSVRFYYRPLTPTQYHNEGYKHPRLRYCQDENANVPVPVFFLFDLQTLLCMPETMFTEESLAGENGKVLQGIDDFKMLDFKQIYKNGPMDNPAVEKKKRQAEIIYPEAFPINVALCYVVCRNEIERITLLNLLRAESVKLFNSFHDRVVVQNDCFENNGLYITDCNYYDGRIAVTYSSTYSKKKYTNKYKMEDQDNLVIQAYAEFEWVKSRKIVERRNCKFLIDYENAETITFTGLQKPAGANALYMRMYFENRLMCYVCWHLNESAIL